MSAPGARRPFISIEDYLAGEADSEQRHDYIDGQVYAMTPAARRKGCQLFTSDMKVRVDIADKTSFYYPDLVLSCDPQDREKYFRRAPCLLVEVLSESTARVDRREKLLAYQTLPSLQGYLLVEQDLARVELYRRDTGWRVQEVEQGDIMLPCLDTPLSLPDIYQDVTFPAAT